jgi:serine/threonine-protein kinase ATR
MPRRIVITLFGTLLLISASGPQRLSAAEPPAPRPLMKDFLGVNGHTVQFRPELYAQVCRKVRDYHSFEWDMGKETDFVPHFPEARNRVNWNTVYGSWDKAGFETDVCIMFNDTPPDQWKDLAKDAHAYGAAFARAFGPSSEKKLVSSLEIGNEPGNYSDEKYRELFQSMARGLRDGDPKLKILTCNMTVGKSGNYEKSVSCVAGLESLYDVLSIHTYAMAEGWPTWRRSFPEDPKIDFLKSVDALIAWRNANARGKPVWVTEFGWDATTKPAPKTGDFAKWDGNVSDQKQAQYLVRAFLVFAAMDVERAYLYFFNDSDEPSFHASSGITRNFEPKPAFRALAHLYRSLGDYRFSRVMEKEDGEIYVYEFVHGTQPKNKIVVAWSPTGAGRSAEVDLPVGTSRVVRAEKMPVAAGDAPPVRFNAQAGAVRFTLEESPIYFWIAEH